jgi:uncharacterized protein (UPF0128 family)
MVIGKRWKAPMHLKITRADVLLSGERVIEKKSLQHILSTHVKGYAIEVIMNHYFMAQNLPVARYPFHAQNFYKFKKLINKIVAKTILHKKSCPIWTAFFIDRNISY